MLLAPGRTRTDSAALRRRAAVTLCALVWVALAAHGQQPAPSAPPDATPPAAQSPSATAPDATQQPTAQTASPSAADTPAPAPTAQTPSTAPAATQPAEAAPETKPEAAPPGGVAPGGITEEELKQQLVGKQFYLRGGYLGDSITFNEHGRIIGHSPQGSYALSIVQIDRVHLTKHKVELEGIRYGLHFNEQLAYEDSSTAFDKVRITPKKKLVRLTIDREILVNPKKKKEPAPAKEKDKGKAVKPAATTTAAPAASTADSAEPSEADQLKASIAAAPAAERPADPTSVTTTTSQAHANRILLDAIDAIFAPGLDQRMMAAMPDFWKLYYQAVANKADYRPADPTVLRQNTVDQKAHLLTAFEPDSNEFAQAAGVAGMALYHTIIGADGQPGEIAVARPIGFGLDESAVASIRKAKFSPAIKNGQPVPVMLDLVVQFRIFSQRTAAVSTPDLVEKDKPAAPVLPGPYSVPHPN